MAGDWLKVELSTVNKPEVIRIARELGMDRYAVLGHLIEFWAWAGANSVDGIVDGVASQDVDMVLTLPGFALALSHVGWLKFDDERKQITLPKFDRHNGESSKKRALASRRQQKWRNANVTLNELPEKRREEKRRYKSIKPIAQSDKSLLAGGSVNGDAVEYIPLAGGSQWGVSKDFLGELERAYPAVDGPATLKEIRAWCVSNPTRCKTKAGVGRFLNRWFQKVQDHG